MCARNPQSRASRPQHLAAPTDSGIDSRRARRERPGGLFLLTTTTLDPRPFHERNCRAGYLLRINRDGVRPPLLSKKRVVDPHPPPTIYQIKRSDLYMTFRRIRVVRLAARHLAEKHVRT